MSDNLDKLGSVDSLVKQIQDHTRKRRISDRADDDVVESFAACPAFHDHSSIPRMLEILEKIAEKQEEQAKKLEEVAEIVTAWNNTKGFIKTLSTIGTLLKWIVATCAAAAAIWASIKYAVTH